MRCSLPPAAAQFHSPYVGKRGPAHAQNANASNQVTLLIGKCSCVAGTSVQVGIEVASDAVSAAESAGRNGVQTGCQPLFAIFGCAPAPAAGGFTRVPPPDATKA